MIRVGYSFWGFLADHKIDETGRVISTPDGNAFYSWSIIYELLRKNCEVTSIMPDRDKPSIKYNISNGIQIGECFESWAKLKRTAAYTCMNHIDYSMIYWTDNIKSVKEQLFRLWDNHSLENLDIILHEWRMEIPGRNDLKMQRTKVNRWQPDYLIQEALLEYCSYHDIKVVIFDLDYKLSGDTISDLDETDLNYYIFELGRKFLYRRNARTVYIPFDFGEINTFEPHPDPVNNLVYVGNRYERDESVSRYIPIELDKVNFYGNWLESGRDSKERWPTINFKPRLQTGEMYDAYNNSLCTVLLAKPEYYYNWFMTARLIESIFYGTVPLFPSEFDVAVIDKYTGAYGEILTVHDAEEVRYKIEFFRKYPKLRLEIIRYLRDRLKFMDVKYFVEQLLRI